MPRPAHGLTRLDAVALGVLGLWCVWVVVSSVHAGRSPLAALPYLIPPVTMLAGAGVGRLLGARETRLWVSAALLGLAVVCLAGWLISPGPGKLPTRYPNANAAAGAQLIAACSLAWLAQRRTRRALIEEPPPSTRPVAPSPPLRWVVPVRTRSRWLPIVALLGAVGVVLANGSLAGTAVAAGVLIVGVVAALTRRGPWRWVSVSAGAAVLALAAYAQASLARTSVWPEAAVSGLSRVRKQLWSEALALWARHPVTGGGAGSFRETNALSLDPDLATAHSATLQVGSEFGFVGLGILALIWGIGLLLASRRDRGTTLIAVSAWVALGVHATIDHLYEFVAVSFGAAAVLGWASTPQKSSMSPSVRRQADAGGGEAASGRDVKSGPAPGTGRGTNPAEGPVRSPIA